MKRAEKKNTEEAPALFLFSWIDAETVRDFKEEKKTTELWGNRLTDGKRN